MMPSQSPVMNDDYDVQGALVVFPPDVARPIPVA
jgi:hypothetical protein